MDDDPGLLPDWYMPMPQVGASQAGRGRKIVAWLIVVSCVAVPAVGLCNTFGELVLA